MIKRFSANRTFKLILVSIGMLSFACWGQETPGEKAQPKVLIIGDSISIGYTEPVRELLQGKAEVHRIPGNGGHTGRGLELIDSWLEGGPWDVIHFNWGLWDLAYRPGGSKEKGLDKINGTQSWPIDQYEQNLRLLVARLKATGARLIWAGTTPVPEGEPGRFAGDEIRYNAVAAKIMAENDIAVDDLHAHALKKIDSIQKPHNVHFTEAGSRYLAEKVAASITEALASPKPAPDENRPPNIVLVLVDDMGWTDVACFGSRYYETPNIDRLARRGMKFTQAYAACAVCSPTRAAVMTGRYPARVGITDWIHASGPEAKEALALGKNLEGFDRPRGRKLLTPINKAWLEHDEITIAELLKAKGYASCHVGKWHLGPKGWYPDDQGFDENHGGYEMGHPPSYFDPFSNKHAPPIPTLPSRDEGQYLTDREADEATAFIRSHRDRPFFLYMAHYAVHSPLQAKPEIIKKYEAKPKTNQKVPVYAAMVQSVDDSVGRIMDCLDENGLTGNTLFIFTSDNGGAVHFPATDNAPLRKGKGYAYEGGLRVPFIASWPGVIAPGAVNETPVSSIDLMPTFAQAAGVDLPGDRVIDGQSLMPLFKSEGGFAPRPLFWHFPHYWWGIHIRPYSVIRKGDWKLIRRYENGQRELYNLARDIGEEHDLAGEMPDKVKALDAELTEALTEQKARLPKPNPDDKNP